MATPRRPAFRAAGSFRFAGKSRSARRGPGDFTGLAMARNPALQALSIEAEKTGLNLRLTRMGTHLDNAAYDPRPRILIKNGYHRPWTYSPHSWQPELVVDSTSLKILGDRIRRRRKELGWTQEELAERAKIDRSYIGGVERGGRNLTFTILCQISAALECDVAAITVGLPNFKK